MPVFWWVSPTLLGPAAASEGQMAVDGSVARNRKPLQSDDGFVTRLETRVYFTSSIGIGSKTTR
jgi:hypothetical protein